MSERRAVLLLGHGSKLDEANETLRRVASTLGGSGRWGAVQAAFLQMERPDFQEALSGLVNRGYSDITVMPYFLYSGAHVTKDLPDELNAAVDRHPGVRLKVTKNLGFHSKLIDVVVERIEELEGNGSTGPETRPLEDLEQHPIERESFRLIDGELGPTGFSPEELGVVKRVIHSTADFDFKDIIRFAPGAIEAGVGAVQRGCNIITDVKMVEAGISKRRLSPFGSKVYCFSSDEDVTRQARVAGSTRTAASIKKAAGYLDGGIAVVGNAPTALVELIKLVKSGKARPALIIGVPVGFVGAVEAKKELAASDLTYITTVGRKGGSTVAVAVINALAIEAAKAELR